MDPVAAARNFFLVGAFGALALSLTGCGIGPEPRMTAADLAPVSGSVYGGQQPLIGSVVSLVAAGTTGYGSTPTVLSTTFSDSNGNYRLPTHGTCPTPDSLVYVQASGGSASTGFNGAISLAAILGKCSAATDSAFIVVNEATTVAAAYVLAPFATVSPAGTGVGTSATNITGLNNAVPTALTLVNSTTGQVNQTNQTAGVVLPSTLVNTLADILASCVNTTTANSTTCSGLFSASTYNDVEPTDTFQAALSIAQHPGNNVAGLYSLVSASAPFQPTVASSTPPNDFSLAIAYNGGGIAAQGTNAVAIDAAGNAWVSDYFTNSSSTASGLIEITPDGSYPGGPTGFGNGFLGPMNNIAIDQSGYIWADVNSGTPSVTAVTPSGTLYTSIPNAVSPNGIAIDAAGDVWYSSGGNNANTFAEIVNNNDGTYSTGTTYTAAEHFGVDVCITPAYVYTISYGYSGQPYQDDESSAVTQLNTATGVLNSVQPDNGVAGLSGCAVDNSGNLLLADFGYFNGVEIYSPALALSNSYAINGSVYPQELALDGLGNIFVATYVPANGTATYNSATYNPASLVELNSTGTLVSPSVGYLPTTGDSLSGGTGLLGLTSYLVAPGGVAIDASGNVWLTGNDGQSTPSDGNTNNGPLPAYVTKVVGIAAPVVTPKSVALRTSTIATRP